MHQWSLVELRYVFSVPVSGPRSFSWGYGCSLYNAPLASSSHFDSWFLWQVRRVYLLLQRICSGWKLLRLVSRLWVKTDGSRPDSFVLQHPSSTPLQHHKTSTIMMALLFIVVSLFLSVVVTGFTSNGVMPPRHRSSQQLQAAAEGITLKIALDRKWGVADKSAEKSERFTSPDSLDMVHRLRRCSGGVLIGKVTVADDNPSLTVRRFTLDDDEEQPVRIILDSQLSLNPKEYTIFNDGLATIVYHDSAIDDSKVQTYSTDQTQCVGVPLDDDGRLDLGSVVEDLMSKQGMTHVMVEGGPAVARGFLQQNLVDRAIVVIATEVEFIDPYPSGMTEESLSKGGLECLGQVTSGDGDVLHCWSRPNVAWPSDELKDWP